MDIAAFVSAFGAGLLLVYALGLRIPFLVIALAANLLLARLSKIHKYLPAIQKAGGVRMNADDITGNQHCWAEFYLNGTGWVSADPADVLKAVLKGCWTKDQQETKDKAEYYWGGLDSQRVQLSAGRDITLSLRKTTRRSTTLAIRTARWTAPPPTSTTRRTSPAASPSPRSR